MTLLYLDDVDEDLDDDEGFYDDENDEPEDEDEGDDEDDEDVEPWQVSFGIRASKFRSILDFGQ